MKRVTIIIIIACIFLIVPACKKSGSADNCPPNETTQMIRIQTQCADAWGYGSNNNETVALLKNYLLQKQVVACKIELNQTFVEYVCAACICSRGYAFHVWVQNRYTDSLIKEGFKIK